MAKTKTIKSLIEKSIIINGIGHPDTKTIFHLNEIPLLAEDATEEEKKAVSEKEVENKKVLDDMRFKSLASISGRKLSINFKYLEGSVETASRFQTTIPFDLDESGVKTFILDEITKSLI